VSLTDEDGTFTGGTHAVMVDNVAPTANAGPDKSGLEGSGIYFSFSCTDPGASDTWTASVNWGDDTTQNLGAVVCNGSSFGTSHTYADNGNFEVTLTVTDDDLGEGTDTSYADVANVAPTITSASGGVAVDCSSASTLTVEFTDPGTDDTFSAVVNWGDGSSVTYSSVTSPFMAMHTYASAGAHNVTVEISDDDGGTDSENATLVVNYTIVGGGIQPPIKQDGSSVFKWTSTIPVKGKVQDCDGTYPDDLSPTIQVFMVSNGVPSGTAEEIYSTSGADTGYMMRFSASDIQYIYNLATKSLGTKQATYKVIITIPETMQKVEGYFATKP
jgi:PKD repeat protein